MLIHHTDLGNVRFQGYNLKDTLLSRMTPKADTLLKSTELLIKTDARSSIPQTKMSQITDRKIYEKMVTRMKANYRLNRMSVYIISQLLTKMTEEL